MSKGISPLIAAVLLIAFTMSVASLFAQWAPQIMQSVTGGTINQSENIGNCNDIILEIRNGNNTSATVTQDLGRNTPGRITVTWFYENAIPIENSTQRIDDKNEFLVYEVDDFEGIDTSDWENRNLSSIEAEPTNCDAAPSATYEP